MLTFWEKLTLEWLEVMRRSPDVFPKCFLDQFTLNCRWTAAARQIANGRVLSETLVILSDSFAADFYTISARHLSNRRGNFKVCSKEREEPKPNVFRCSNHRALIEVTDLQTVCKQAVFST